MYMKTLTRSDLQRILSKVEYTNVVLTCDECLSNKEKAERLCRSEDTTSSHMKSIFKKVNISKVTELSKIYFNNPTLTLITAILICFQGLILPQRRSRIRLEEQRTIQVAQRRLLSRRRERSIPLDALLNADTIAV